MRSCEKVRDLMYESLSTLKMTRTYVYTSCRKMILNVISLTN